MSKEQPDKQKKEELSCLWKSIRYSGFLIIPLAISLTLLVGGLPNCDEAQGQERAKCIAKQTVNNVRRVDFEDGMLNVAYEIKLTVVSPRSQAHQDIIELVCELRESGFTSRPFHVISIVPIKNAFGREVDASGVEVVISTSNAWNISCDNPASVNLYMIAQSYYANPLVE